MAEATFWPLMPDVVLVPLAAAHPATWWRVTLAALAGSLVGGAISYRVGQKFLPGPILSRLPLVRPAMIAAADEWLAREGPRGVRHQALSGLPFKVFALLAGARGTPLLPFLAYAGLVRGARFAVLAGASAWLGRRFEGTAHRYSAPLLVLWVIAFTLGLWRMVADWERRGR